MADITFGAGALIGTAAADEFSAGAVVEAQGNPGFGAGAYVALATTLLVDRTTSAVAVQRLVSASAPSSPLSPSM
jgi:hypothetical protein